MSIVKIHKGDKTYKIEAEQGTNLLKLLDRNSLYISNPCGGKGTCGKCKVRVKGMEHGISPRESQLLGQASLKEGFRLACYLDVKNDIEVTLDTDEKAANIMTQVHSNVEQLNPIVTKEYITLEAAGLNNSFSDVERMNLGKVDSIDILRKLAKLVTSDKTDVTLVRYMDRLIGVEKGDTRDKLYGIAADIGTTTIAIYLINLNTGKTESVYSCLNPQKAYGDDVITRIQYSVENDDGLKQLNEAVIVCFNKAISTLSEKMNIDSKNIYSMVLAGNTTMLHLFMGIDPKRLSVSPFVPVTTSLEEFCASALGLGINPEAYVSVLPGVSAYVGADTLCAILGSSMLNEGETALLVDIGTNGEIALYANDRIYSCSVAAGPAFEGAHLRNGVGGIEGAICKVILTKDIYYTTIGNVEPIGICGSGIIDATAQLLEKGLIDYTGRMLDIEELSSDIDEKIKAGLTQADGMSAFELYNNIYVTQKDIREIQNAKAAIAAGIKTLAKYAGVKLDEIQKVYLAGGFGSYINVASALKIGLLPSEFEGKVTACGNAAGTGAIMALNSKACFRQLEAIKEKTTYIELSGNNEFVDYYIESMTF